jgi:arylsulfatase A-like enzyme
MLRRDFMKMVGLSAAAVCALLPAVAALGQGNEPDKRVNIVWIVAEDMSPNIPASGDNTIETPNLSRLAAEGVYYDNFFTPAAVCAPARAAIATGMYPTRIAANQMRTGPWLRKLVGNGVSAETLAWYGENWLPEGVRPYEAIPPEGARMMSEVLRAHGYYCTNNGKEDYQFHVAPAAWDESSDRAHWRNRGEGQPFFSVFNLAITNELQIWFQASKPLAVDEDLDVPVPPYLPDTEIGRQDIRRMYSNIKIMDDQVGGILDQLEEDGLLEETVIFWYTDHGGPLPRQKRLLHDSGMHVPMIIRFPHKEHAGTRNDDLISFIDLAPTAHSLAGIRPSDLMDGRAFLGEFRDPSKRKYVHGAADRFDANPADPIRAVRDKRFKYLRYYDTDKPMYYHVDYREQQPIMQELQRMRKAGELNAVQALWFRDSKPAEELFDTQADPHEINDLAGDPAYAEKLAELRAECDRWLEETDDINLMPETEMVKKLWPDGKQPETAPPEISIHDKMVTITCATPGASIAYKLVPKEGEEPEAWTVYTQPFPCLGAEQVMAVSHRIGFKRGTSEQPL